MTAQDSGQPVAEQPSPASQASGAPVPSGLGSTGQASGGQRLRFGAHELAIVLSHYDVGVIQKVQEYPRGSRKAPKLILRSDTGAYLLKRRARGKDDPFKVAFCHGLQLHLAERQFPLPHLIGTRRDNNSMLQLEDAIYELFEYIKGTNYDQSLEATQDAGKTLALFHRLLSDYQSPFEPAQGSYHASKVVAESIRLLPQGLAKASPPADLQGADEVCRSVRQAYVRAAKAVNELGMDAWPMQIVHGDWHPGNMLFRGARVVAVIDYDAARVQQRVLDAANGALQFSIIGGGEDPGQWPDYIDESRFRRFLRGYDSVPDCVLSRAEVRAIPHLMIEALIAESVIPIAATGFFARMEGIAFLRMVDRKIKWLQEHADELVQKVDQ